MLIVGIVDGLMLAVLGAAFVDGGGCRCHGYRFVVVVVVGNVVEAAIVVVLVAA